MVTDGLGWFGFGVCCVLVVVRLGFCELVIGATFGCSVVFVCFVWGFGFSMM